MSDGEAMPVPGTLVERIGPDRMLDEVGRLVGTIPYEIPAPPGRRIEQRIDDAD